LVFAFTAVVTPVTSDWRASDPEERPAPVRVLVANDQTSEAAMPVLMLNCFPVVPAATTLEVATFQTSEARVPKLERVLVLALPQTAVGIVDASEVEAVRTVASVWELIVEMAEVNWELVLALTAVVPREMLEASEVEADKIVEFTAVVIPEVWVLVFPLTEAVPKEIFEASDVEAAETTPFVLAVPAAIAAANEVEAMLVLALTAVVTPDTWLLVFPFMFEAKEVEAERIVALVFALTAEVIPEV